MLVLVCLLVLGQVETRFNLKPVTVTYDVVSFRMRWSRRVGRRDQSSSRADGLTMQTVHIGKTCRQHCRVQFMVEAYRSKQDNLRTAN